MEVYGLQNSLIKDACGAVVRADGRDSIVEAVSQVIYHEKFLLSVNQGNHPRMRQVLVRRGKKKLTAFSLCEH